LSIAEAKKLVSQVPDSEFIKSQIEGYSFTVKRSNYGTIEQRWLVVESEARKKSDLRKLEKRIQKLEENVLTYSSSTSSHTKRADCLGLPRKSRLPNAA
jgi:transposase